MDNHKIRDIISKGMTEDYFIENFDELMNYRGFMRFAEKNPNWKPNPHVRNRPVELERSPIKDCLSRIHRMNIVSNNWADIKSISDKLKLFLALKGENI
jgi:hypothetical protein